MTPQFVTLYQVNILVSEISLSGVITRSHTDSCVLRHRVLYTVHIGDIGCMMVLCQHFLL